MAFSNPLPSLAPMDLLIGILGAVLIRLIVYVKGKNAKKYRKGIEYGSALDLQTNPPGLKPQAGSVLLAPRLMALLNLKTGDTIDVGPKGNFIGNRLL